MKVRLGDVCKIQSGGTPSRSEPTYWNHGIIPWVKISDIKGKYLNTTEEYITEAGLENSTAKIFLSGTILYTIFATLGETCILNIDAATNQAIAGIHVESNLVFNDYLYYYLVSQKDTISKMGRGVAQNNINMKILREFEVPLPPLDEQRRIAAVLDNVSDLIAKRRAQLDKLDELVKARFVEMFGDPLIDSGRYTKVPLGSLVEVGSSKRIFEKEYVREGIPFYRTKEIVELSKGNQITTELFITRQRYDEIKKEYGVPKAGDLLISAVGTIGVIWIVDGKNNFYFKDGNLLRVVTNEKFTPIYLNHLLETLIGAYKLRMSSGTAYAALTISALKEMLVYEVPIEEQKQFASFVEQTDKSKLTIHQSLDKLEILKKALMQEYFDIGDDENDG